MRSFAKERCIFCVLLHSLHSITFFAKERCILLRSLQKNMHSLRSFPFFRKKRNVLLGLISRQKLKKRMEKNIAFFKRTEKNGTFRAEKNVVPNPD